CSAGCNSASTPSSSSAGEPLATTCPTTPTVRSAWSSQSPTWPTSWSTARAARCGRSPSRFSIADLKIEEVAFVFKSAIENLQSKILTRPTVGQLQPLFPAMTRLLVHLGQDGADLVEPLPQLVGLILRRVAADDATQGVELLGAALEALGELVI